MKGQNSWSQQELDLCTQETLSKIKAETKLHMYNIYKKTNMMQLGSMFICNCNIALHVSDAFCVHLQEHLETVEAASGE